MTTTRRSFIALAASAAGAGLIIGSARAAAGSTDPMAFTPDMPELAIGSPDAPVTMVEYASLTCGHCAAFHMDTLPILKERFMDTGDLRFILREFPLDPLATAGFMLARCGGERDPMAVIDHFFADQAAIMGSGPVIDNLSASMANAGFDRDTLELCLADDAVFEHIAAVERDARDRLDIAGTPTFFVNGDRLQGNRPIAEFVEAIERHLQA